MDAFGTTAAAGSVTIPEIEPKVAWANALAADRRHRRKRHGFIVPSLGTAYDKLDMFSEISEMTTRFLRNRCEAFNKLRGHV
jgi:hypothetical protein